MNNEPAETIIEIVKNKLKLQLMHILLNRFNGLFFKKIVLKFTYQFNDKMISKRKFIS